MSHKLVGIDEVGRGCWAGPLVAAAVILGSPIDGLKDSKKLSKTARERLTVEIEAKALAIGLGWVWPGEIDSNGLSAAVKTAMRQALDRIETDFSEIIIDGNINYFMDEPRAKAIVRADDTFPAVSAASIIAKVARDKYMAQQAENFPGYGFEKHVGYGTALHIAALKGKGVCSLHRLSYKPVRTIMESQV